MFKEIIINPKVNLTLKVGNKRPLDNRHYITSLVSFVKPYNSMDTDIISFYKANEFSLEVSSKIKLNHQFFTNNLIKNTYDYIVKNYHNSFSDYHKIIIIKRLPLGGGIGGGSLNSACVINFLDKQNHLNLGYDFLKNVTKHLGSDIPVCVFGKSSFVSGVGEVVRSIDIRLPYSIVLVNPGIFLSTKLIYEKCQRTMSCKDDLLKDYLGRGKINLLEYIKAQSNDLLQVAMSYNSRIRLFYDYLLGFKSIIYTGMSGSGSTFFLIVANKSAAQRLQKIFQAKKLWSLAGELI